MLTIAQIMQTSPVIPVIVIDDIDDAVPLATALVKGGLKVLEVTLRTEAGMTAIRQIKQQVPDAIVGAGTVIAAADYHAAVAAGAEFIVSPGCTEELLTASQATSVPFLPGVATASEVMEVLRHGLSQMKFFPAEAAGGIPMFKSIAGPLPQVQFCPTGGINKALAVDYLALDNVLCVGGTWMLDKQAIAAKDWGSIEQQAHEAASLVSSV